MDVKSGQLQKKARMSFLAHLAMHKRVQMEQRQEVQALQAFAFSYRNC